MKHENGMVLFWHGIFSQWYMHDIVIDGVMYNCCEQYMMAEKANLFNDPEAWAMIMEARNPRDQKQLGRKVNNFDLNIWNSKCRNIVYRANLAKFSDPELEKYLMSFGENAIIAEASPSDTIWGIGLRFDDPLALDVRTWKGTNWLGEAIMSVRRTLCGIKQFEQRFELIKEQTEDQTIWESYERIISGLRSGR
jgi:ribA/ribD-fused uncharacterized protein